MRLTAIFPLLCALASLILSLLCLFAGSTPSFLPNAELLTLNTSRIGHTELFNTTDNSSGGLFGDIINGIEGDINNLLNNATADIAQAFDIRDFYAAHIMNYCEGYYEPEGETEEQDPKENITYCSGKTALFHFDPTTIIQNELAPGLNLSDLKWPSEIEDAIKGVELAGKVMFVFYIIGIVFTAFALLAATWGVLAEGRISAFINFLFDIAAFLFLTIASAISTAIILKATDEINKYGADIGIAAYKGSEFIGLTWAATGVMLLASFMWIAECCAGRRKKNRQSFKEKSSF